MSRQNAKQTLIDAAHQLILSRGYPATTVDGICKAAGVSKGSFYHFFDTKEACGLEVLEYYYARTINTIARGDYASLRDPVQRMYGLIDHIEQQAEALWSRGCLMGGIAMDLGEGDTAISTRNAELFTDMTRRLALVLAPATRTAGSGLPRDRGAALELAGHLMAVIEGSVVLARAHGDWRHIPRGIRRFRRYLDCLVAS